MELFSIAWIGAIIVLLLLVAAHLKRLIGVLTKKSRAKAINCTCGGYEYNLDVHRESCPLFKDPGKAPWHNKHLLLLLLFITGAFAVCSFPVYACPHGRCWYPAEELYSRGGRLYREQ